MRSSIPCRLAGLMTLAAVSALAQSAPDAGALQNQQQRLERQSPRRLPSAEAPSAKPVQPAQAEGLKVRVRDLRFSGATGLASAAELRQLVSESLNHELTFAEIEELATRLTLFLRKSKGYFLARAYLPRQDLTEGVLQVVLQDGHLDGASGQGLPVRVLSPQGSLRMGKEPLEKLAGASLKPGAAARVEDIERAALLMNDLPGLQARARLEPGMDPGSTRVIFDIEEAALFTGSAWADNYGNRDTGSWQGNAALQLNDPLHVGDQLGGAFTHSEGMDLGRLNYSLPVGPAGLRLSGGGSYMKYTIIHGVGELAGLKGSSAMGTLSASYPLVRTQALSVYATAGYTFRSLVDDSSVGQLRDKRSHGGSLGLSAELGDALLGGGRSSANLGLSLGHLDLSGNPDNELVDALTYQTAGNYTKFSLALSRLQSLPNRFSLLAVLTGQYAGKNLDSSEAFLLGGPYGVRAYPGSEGMGDAGWLGNLELHYELPVGARLGTLQLIGFGDAGGVSLHQDAKGLPVATATGRNNYTLSGAGLGIALSRASHHSVRLMWAAKLGDNPGRTLEGLDADGRSSPSRFWVQAVFWY